VFGAKHCRRYFAPSLQTSAGTTVTPTDAVGVAEAEEVAEADAELEVEAVAEAEAVPEADAEADAEAEAVAGGETSAVWMGAVCLLHAAPAATAARSWSRACGRITLPAYFKKKNATDRAPVRLRAERRQNVEELDCFHRRVGGPRGLLGRRRIERIERVIGLERHVGLQRILGVERLQRIVGLERHVRLQRIERFVLAVLLLEQALLLLSDVG